MIISQFNRMLAKHGRAALLIIAIIIIGPFVFFYGPGTDSIFDMDGPRRGTIGRMYGKEIARDEFMHHLYAADITALVNWGMAYSNNDRWFAPWVEDTLRRIRALREVSRLDLGPVSNQQIIDTIQALPRFQQDGRFDKTKLAAFRETQLASRNLSGRDLDQIIKENILIERLEQTVASGEFASPAEIRAEFERSEEKFDIKYADYSIGDFRAQAQAALEPSEEAINEYFVQHKDEMTLAEQKRVRVAHFPMADYTAGIEVSDEEIKDNFEKNQKRYAEKTLDEVKPQVELAVRNQKAQQAVFDAAKEFLVAVQAKQETVNTAAEALEVVAKERNVSVKDTGPFAPDQPIPNIGTKFNLSRQAYRLDQTSPLSEVIHETAGDKYVAAWLETIPGQKPAELNADARKLVIEALKNRTAAAWYETNVEPFRELLVNDKTPEDLIADFQQKLAGMEGKSDDEKAELLADYQRTVNESLKEFFQPVQKKALVAEFTSAQFRANVTVADEDIQNYYTEHQAEYNQEEVKASHILLKVPADATEEKTAEIRAKSEDLRKQIVEGGADFAQLAMRHSEDNTARTGGDLGYFAKGKMVPPFEEAAFSLKTGEISQPVKTRFGFHLIKVTDHRSARSVEEVSDEIREKVIAQKSEKLAAEAAYSFGRAVYEQFDNWSPASNRAPAEIFRRLTESMNIETKETGWFDGTGRIDPYGYLADLAKKAYILDRDRPISDVIKARDSFYMACWTDTKPASLPEFGTGKDLAWKVQNKIMRAKQLELARKAAAEAVQTLRAKLQEGIAFDEASKGLKVFTEVPAFTTQQPPANIPGAAHIVELVADQGGGTVIEPVETENGAVVAYLVSRSLPPDEEFEMKKASIEQRVMQQKRNAAIMALYERLSQESETQLSEAWKAR